MDKQTLRVEKLLRSKWTTPLDALKHTGCMRLAARVHVLKEAGIEVHDRWVKTDDGKRFKSYRIL